MRVRKQVKDLIRRNLYSLGWTLHTKVELPVTACFKFYTRLRDSLDELVKNVLQNLWLARMRVKPMPKRIRDDSYPA